MLSYLPYTVLASPFRVALILLVLAVVVKYTYRLFFSPLSRFPGPKFAACSKLFEAYHVLVKNDWLEALEELHRQHGSIVRIGPGELHFSDHQFSLRHHSRPDLQKCQTYYGLLGYLLGGLPSPHSHKQRKSIIQPLFTGKALSEFSDYMMNRHIGTLLERLNLSATCGGAVNITYILWAYTNDIMLSFIFGSNFEYLKSNDLKSLHDKTRAFSAIDLATVLRAMPVVKKMFDIIPSLRRSSPLGWTDELVGNHLKAILDGIPEQGKVPQNVISKFWHQLRDERAVTHEISQAIFIGNESLLSNLTFLLHHIMQHPECVNRLRAELDTLDHGEFSNQAWQDPKVVKLEYLDAVCRESTRMSSPGWHRQPRKVAEPVEYEQIVIPPMTSMSFTLRLLERDPTLYPDPNTFKPERWLGDAPEARNARRSSVTFGTGTRTCLGQFVARQVLRKTLAALIYNFDLFFFDEEADKKDGHRYLTTYPKMGQEGYFTVRVAPRLRD